MTEQTGWEKKQGESVENCKRAIENFQENSMLGGINTIIREYKENYKYQIQDGNIIEPKLIIDKILNNPSIVQNDLVFYTQILQIDPKTPDCKFLAYYPTYKHFNNGRKVSTTPGKYLLKFYAHLWDSEKEYTDFVRKYLESVANPNNVFFAKTVGEIQKVYDTGPRSCMGNGGESSDLKRLRTRNKIHPVAAYASGDLAVAYLKHPTNKDKITARTVVWPDKKLYSGKAYGDVPRLMGGLRELGYSSGPFYGAKVKKIKTRTGVILPYMDNGSYLRHHDDKYFEIVDRSEKAQVVAQNAGGFVKTFTCANCKGACAGEKYSVYFDTARPKIICKACRMKIAVQTCNKCCIEVVKEHTKIAFDYISPTKDPKKLYGGGGLRRNRVFCKKCYKENEKKHTCDFCERPYNNSEVVSKKYKGKKMCVFCFKSDKTKTLSKCGNKIIDKKKVGVKCNCFTCHLVSESV